MPVLREGAGLDSQVTADCCPTVCLSQTITQVLRRNDLGKGFCLLGQLSFYVIFSSG